MSKSFMPISKVLCPVTDQSVLTKWMMRVEMDESGLKTWAQLQAVTSSNKQLQCPARILLKLCEIYLCNHCYFLLYFEDLKESAGKGKHCQIKSHRIGCGRRSWLCLPFGLNFAQPDEIVILCVCSELGSNTVLALEHWYRPWWTAFVLF